MKVYPQTFINKIQDTLRQGNFFHQIFDKQFNIYRLVNSLQFEKSFYQTNIKVENEYEGTKIKANEFSSKDAENLNVSITQSFLKGINIFFQTNYLLNSDSKQIGLNQAEKLNSNIGVKLIFPKNIESTLSYGFEKNKQVSIVQNGPRLFLETSIKNLSLTEVNLTSYLGYENVKLKDGRTNSNFTLYSNIFGSFEGDNALSIAFVYNNLKRDYIVFPVYLTNFFETRKEDKIAPSFNLNYNLFSKTTLNFSGQMVFYQIKRYYNIFDPTSPVSATERILSEQWINLNFEILSTTKFFEPKIGLNYYFRTEENNLDKRFELDHQNFSQLSLTEIQKNNYQTRLNAYYILNLPFKDNFTSLKGNISILRYDTPSPLNDDDRDEFSFLTSLSTKQKFSEYYTLGITFDLQLNHLVFLKASKSSLNNWNRAIKLSTSSIYKTNYFIWKPNFEIFSNYLVYDFEIIGNNVKSYAFRQFTYRDSLEIKLSKFLTLSNTFIYKYSERGNLFWREFAMTKEMEIKEIFLKTMLNLTYSKKILYSIGARLYNIKQTPLNKNLLRENYFYYSYSPEVEIKFFLGNNNMIFLQGWYELKFWNYKIVGENPNLTITTRVNL